MTDDTYTPDLDTQIEAGRYEVCYSRVGMHRYHVLFVWGKRYQAMPGWSVYRVVSQSAWPGSQNVERCPDYEDWLILHAHHRQVHDTTPVISRDT